jgi:hypothetical protein
MHGSSVVFGAPCGNYDRTNSHQLEQRLSAIVSAVAGCTVAEDEAISA